MMEGITPSGAFGFYAGLSFLGVSDLVALNSVTAS